VRLHYHWFLLSLLLSFLVAGCATTPEAKGPDAGHQAAAKRFLHSWGAGELTYEAFQRIHVERVKEQPPAMAEVVQRIFADITPEVFEDLAAEVYARHLGRTHLTDLAQFTESPTGNRFFRRVVGSVMSGKTVNGSTLMQEFDADELTEIMKFAQSEAFLALRQALPTINRELAEAGRRFGEERLREYLDRQ